VRRWGGRAAVSLLLALGCLAPPEPVGGRASGALVVTRPVPAAFKASDDAAGAWLAAQQDVTGTQLVDSFEDFSAPSTPILLSYTYDQAVAIIALAVRGETARAAHILDAMVSLQATDGSWVNSYWAGNRAGEELRKHVGPAAWMALAVMNYEVLTGDTATYHPMATAALDWALQFTQTNGGLAGGLTTWAAGDGSWTPEPWSSTEHNLDAFAALQYFAATTPSKAESYRAAAAGIRRFLDGVVWDANRHRFWGGFRGGSVDGAVPLDVNPWSVLALGPGYASALAYVENAAADPGTDAEHPRYVEVLPFDGATISLYDFDWESDGRAADPSAGDGVLGPDIWFEGSAFMSLAHATVGNTVKADAIIGEIRKKQGASGSRAGGVPYSLLGTNNQYWKMSQQNCVSSTGWLVLAIHRWNPFTATEVEAGDAGDGGTAADAGAGDGGTPDGGVDAGGGGTLDGGVDAGAGDGGMPDGDAGDGGPTPTDAGPESSSDGGRAGGGDAGPRPSLDGGADNGGVTGGCTAAGLGSPVGLELLLTAGLMGWRASSRRR